MQYKLNEYLIDIPPEKLEEFIHGLFTLVNRLGGTSGGSILPYTKEDELIDLQDITLLQKKINRKVIRKSIPRKGKGEVTDGKKRRLSTSRRTARQAG